ncbi:hypothetical protein EDM53_04460 [Rickettsiales endosymbiont of Peranema trichophorum]|uniref:cell division protein FtsL n=1 Tax=Rickettsiales endosymbiont of Peranema trichophorum TaxID=2486577 RepID=UPI001023DD53|nr:hypothetical protein [Rickettsiales endosymbiont of Peranema trichophorum]RZI45981.1 hypothetical protein EDM53_04460 [Rickettsiales endosymbiont of Peranema trichophorum]
MQERRKRQPVFSLTPYRVSILLLLLVASCLLFTAKHRVQLLQKELERVEAEIFQAHEDIHILKAEWSYLTQPKNLMENTPNSVLKELKLLVVEPSNIINADLNDIEMISQQIDAVEEQNKNTKPRRDETNNQTT